MNSIKAPQVQKVKASKSPGPSCPLWNSAPKARAKADALRHVFSWQREAMACQNGNILLHINPVLKSVRQKPVVVKSRKMSKEWYLGWRWANVIAEEHTIHCRQRSLLELELERCYDVMRQECAIIGSSSLQLRRLLYACTYVGTRYVRDAAGLKSSCSCSLCM